MTDMTGCDNTWKYPEILIYSDAADERSLQFPKCKNGLTSWKGAQGISSLPVLQPPICQFNAFNTPGQLD